VEWMVWTLPTALFFACIALLLIGMTLWEWLDPNVPRRGFLPLVTTRGDRLFMGLLAAAYVNLGWLGLTDLPQIWGTLLGFALLGLILSRG